MLCSSVGALAALISDKNKRYRLLNHPLFVAQDVDAYWNHFFMA
ncbi:MAG TPA: hypothetical protein VJ863_12440 [Sphaerochaeta sp.]|nr:hypothetical protein [Sphaerochaeta sp.]